MFVHHLFYYKPILLSRGWLESAELFVRVRLDCIFCQKAGIGHKIFFGGVCIISHGYFKVPVTDYGLRKNSFQSAQLKWFNFNKEYPDSRKTRFL